MVGSVLEGRGIPVRVTAKIANFPDGTRDPRIKKRVFRDPVTYFPSMNQTHSSGHPILEKLRQIIAGGHRDSTGVQLMPGYEPQRENLSWRFKP
jgi:hypothetical protein